MNSLVRINKHLLFSLVCRPACFCVNNFNTKCISPNNQCVSIVNHTNVNSINTFNFIQIRNKYNQKKTENEDDDDDDLNDFADLDTKDGKVVRASVNSLRTDLLIKSGLGLARNKVEAAFYDSRIRVNGKKIPKKSVMLKVGDEIDVVKNISANNKEHIVVSRIEVLSAKETDENITVIMRRFKSLVIENYAGENSWKSNEQSTTE